VAEVVGDVAEEMEIYSKTTMHTQFTEGTSGVSVFLTLMGITTDQGAVAERKWPGSRKWLKERRLLPYK
jgi:hypothetical protein